MAREGADTCFSHGWSRLCCTAGCGGALQWRHPRVTCRAAEPRAGAAAASAARPAQFSRLLRSVTCAPCRSAGLEDVQVLTFHSDSGHCRARRGVVAKVEGIRRGVQSAHGGTAGRLGCLPPSAPALPSIPAPGCCLWLPGSPTPLVARPSSRHCQGTHAPALPARLPVGRRPSAHRAAAALLEDKGQQSAVIALWQLDGGGAGASPRPQVPEHRAPPRLGTLQRKRRASRGARKGSLGRPGSLCPHPQALHAGTAAWPLLPAGPGLRERAAADAAPRGCTHAPGPCARQT